MTPAMRKKANVVWRYKIPIFLWSVVVSQAEIVASFDASGCRENGAGEERATPR